MLTGDKLETAKNIGFSCSLLCPTMHIWEIHSEKQALEFFTPKILNENDNLWKQHIKRALIIESVALKGIH